MLLSSHWCQYGVHINKSD